MNQDIFKEDLHLENDRALLRPLKITDIKSIENISYTEGLFEYGGRVKTRKDLKKYFEYCVRGKEDKTLYPFVIFDKKFNSIAGITMYGEIDLNNKRLEIGWTWLGLDFQGTGLNLASKELLLEYAFNKLGFRRVQFKVDIKNIKSQRAVEKLGGIKEGLLRDYNIQSYGESEGTYVYSILKNEWKKNTTGNDM